jgi:hypothetical protein
MQFRVSEERGFGCLGGSARSRPERLCRPAPKGRSTQAQANGLGLRPRLGALRALKGRDKTAVTATGPGSPFQGFLALRLGLCPRPLAWALVDRPFGPASNRSREATFGCDSLPAKFRLARPFPKLQGGKAAAAQATGFHTRSEAPPFKGRPDSFSAAR